MKTTGIFSLHKFDIRAKPGESFNIVFFGDVHRDSPTHSTRHWKLFLDRARAIRANSYFIGMGDYLDGFSTSERDALVRAAFHDSTRKNIEVEGHGKTKLLAKELEFMRGRIIGLLGGNHYFPFLDGTDSDMRLCGYLGARYLGVCAAVRLIIHCGHGRRLTRDLWLHHGAGGGQTKGGSINRVAKMSDFVEADIFVMGHNHDRACVRGNPRLFIQGAGKGEMKLVERETWIVRSGSFLKSYEDGVSNYNVDAARGPASLGHIELECTPVRTDRKDARELVLSVRGIN